MVKIANVRSHTGKRETRPTDSTEETATEERLPQDPVSQAKIVRTKDCSNVRGGNTAWKSISSPSFYKFIQEEKET